MRKFLIFSKHWRGLAVVPIFLAGVLTIVATSPPGPILEGVTKPYVLAYKDTNQRLRIRWSDDGNAWTSANAATPLIDRAPGLAANPSGLVYLAILEDTVSDVRFITGLGPDTWDSTTILVGDGHRPEVSSGTSIAYISGQKWAVAFRSQNSAKVKMFDMTNTVRDLGPEITPVPGTVNNNVTDKPAIANLNGQVLVSWLMGNQLQMVTGRAQGEDIVWDPGFRFDQTVVESGFGPPVGAHDLATNGQSFYAAVVRKRDALPGELLERHFLFIYTSPNGLNWTRLTSSQEVIVPQSMSVAARATNDLIAMISAQATQLPPAAVFRFNGAIWSTINSADVFGNNPMSKGHDFTLYARY